MNTPSPETVTDPIPNAIPVTLPSRLPRGIKPHQTKVANGKLIPGGRFKTSKHKGAQSGAFGGKR